MGTNIFLEPDNQLRQHNYPLADLPGGPTRSWPLRAQEGGIMSFDSPKAPKSIFFESEFLSIPKK